MKKRILIAIFIATSVIAQTSISSAQAVMASAKTDSWTLIGSRTVDYLIDRDEISIEPSVFNELKFTIKNGTLSMHKCTLHFADGSTKDIEFPDDVKASTERTVDMKGSNLKLDKVIFWYDTDHKSDVKAVVEVWGKK
ncbi:MAG TPA: hypothetical protein PLJ60_11805 [Chryseolinea sp.]|nr:hypothetical protein [Chryseolinea sp.]HPM31008.1 hypothetical protein [Chryseolinea sp.]